MNWDMVSAIGTAAATIIGAVGIVVLVLERRSAASLERTKDEILADLQRRFQSGVVAITSPTTPLEKQACRALCRERVLVAVADGYQLPVDGAGDC